MLKRTLAGIFALSCAITSFSQTSVWYFGNNGGLRFNSTGTTSPETGSVMTTNEGCTAATDNSGNLLFYADGQRIWHGGTHASVTTTMLGSPSSTQSAIIIPLPGNFCTKFLVVTSEGIETTPATPNGLGVALVTVTGTYPAHTVTYDPAVSIVGGGTRFSEKLAVTPDGNGGWWLVAHDFSTGATGGTLFYKYHITNTAAFTGITSSAGAQAALAANLSTQAVGLAHNASNYNAQGQMKFSIGGTKLGLALCGLKYAETYNFNLTSGVLTVDKTLNVGGLGNTYGLEFSPNGNLLYVGQGFTGVGSTCNLYQYDITVATPTPVTIASATATSGQQYPFNGMQLGPDNRIYVSGPFVGVASLSVLNTPDVAGAPGWSSNTVPISGTRTLGLPTVISGQVSCDVPSSSGCNCNGVKATLQSLTLTSSTGTATGSILFNSGGNAIKKIRVTLLNYVVTPSSDQCKNYCAMNNADFGHFVTPVPALTGFTSTLSPYAGGTSAAFANDIELSTGAPRVINNEALTFNFRFPPILALSCCSQTIRACFRVEYIDANCRICDVVICNTSALPNGTDPQAMTGVENGREGFANTPSESQELSVYPNPNNGTFVINTAKIGPDCRYQVTSFEGREIMNGVIRGDSQEINNRDLAPGTYSVFVFKDNRVFTEKIVVMKE